MYAYGHFDISKKIWTLDLSVIFFPFLSFDLPQSLPSSIGFLRKLRILYADENFLEAIPLEVFFHFWGTWLLDCLLTTISLS